MVMQFDGDIQGVRARAVITTANGEMGTRRDTREQQVVRSVVPVAGLLRALGLSADHTEAVA